MPPIVNIDDKPCKRGHVAERGTGLQSRCLECDRQRKKGEYRADGRIKARCGEYREANREELRQKQIARRAARPEYYMLKSARRRARKGGYACTITAADIIIPEFCPLLGIKLARRVGRNGAAPSSPTLDKIIPELGYVPGNVWVISHRANSIKRDATIAELRAIANNLSRAMFPWGVL